MFSINFNLKKYDMCNILIGPPNVGIYTKKTLMGTIDFTIKKFRGCCQKKFRGQNMSCILLLLYIQLLTTW